MSRRSKTACFPEFSPEDSDLNGWKWRMDKHGYARATLNPVIDGKKRPVVVLSHRVVAERMAGRKLTRSELVDHRNFNRIDNKRSNLRIVDQSGNQQNRDPRSIKGLRGVTFHKVFKKWQAQVGLRGKNYFCGLYDTAELAAVAAAKKRHELGFLTSEESAK